MPKTDPTCVQMRIHVPPSKFGQFGLESEDAYPIEGISYYRRTVWCEPEMLEINSIDVPFSCDRLTSDSEAVGRCASEVGRC